MGYEITEKDLPPQLALTRRETVTMKTIGQGMDAGLTAVREQAAATGAELVGPPFVFSPDFGKEEFDLIVCLPVAAGAAAGEGVDLEEIAGGHVASVTHQGAYPDVPKAYEALFAWVGENARTPAGPARETYLNDPKDTPESELLVEIALPLA
jgi:effector-binding domain-containing protein